ncbi:hypothetical protein [Quadrisphaera sp. INWT6]|uniref:hypothetical protein n=1 Tax=Quadrisphaera sp. INWT6 TaxID=2596917 RepID=UPI0018920CCD|nr:hypothetical protein [Quadrisphaera sp. INWT6]MBF5082361.1 hypothetical protein [Quadrisphaera sp. INWT6]
MSEDTDFPAWLTPVQAHDLAHAVRAVAERLEGARRDRVSDPDAARRRAGYRLEAIRALLDRAAGDLAATAGDLQSLKDQVQRQGQGGDEVSGELLGLDSVLAVLTGEQDQRGGEFAALPAQLQVPALAALDLVRAGCKAPGWGYGRTTVQCSLRVSHQLRFPCGDVVGVCGEHAADAERRVVGGVVLLVG